MSLDKQILSACIADRGAYDRIKDHIRDTDLSPPVAFWFKQVRGYYSRDNLGKSIDPVLLSSLGERDIPNPKHAETILGVLGELPEASPANVVEAVLSLRRFNLSMEFAAAASGGDKSKASKLLAELNTIWDVDTLEAVVKSEIEYAKDWGDLDSVVGSANRISTGISSLDSRIGGGVLPGNHITIFGRTEIGKSCLTIALTANLLKQGKSALYVGNEDNINILKARMRQSLLGWTAEQVESMPKKASRRLAELVGDRLTMVHVHPGSISELEDLTETHSPSMLIVDQIRNLSGPEDGMTQRLESNAIRFRSLLGKKNLVGLSVTQAGDRSQGHNQDGPIYLSPGDVDSSRVGLPGTVDLMLGVGCNKDLMARGMRMISFAKNKLHSGPQSREPLLLRFDLNKSQVLEG